MYVVYVQYDRENIGQASVHNLGGRVKVIFNVTFIAPSRDWCSFQDSCIRNPSPLPVTWLRKQHSASFEVITS